jgi:hypothetical protein
MNMKQENNKVRRCVTIQPESMLLELMTKGVFKPETNRALTDQGGECSDCADEQKWCFQDAESWFVEQAGRRLGNPEMKAAVWLWAHERMEQNHLCCDAKPGHVRITLDIPLNDLVLGDYHVLRSIACNEAVCHHELRAIDSEKEPEKAAEEMKRHKEYHSNDLDEDVLEMRKTESWNELFDPRLWEDGRFELYAGGENCSWILGLTPSITLEQIVNVEFLDSAGDAVTREPGERLTLYGRHQGMTILHFDHEGLTRHTKGTFALSPHGHMLPKIRRDARKGIVTKKFSGERLIRNNPKETIDPELQPICPQCGVEGNFVAQFEGQLIQTAKGIQVKFIHSKGDNDYPKDHPEIEDYLDIECNHCGESFFLDEIYIDVNSEGGM